MWKVVLRKQIQGKWIRVVEKLKDVNGKEIQCDGERATELVEELLTKRNKKGKWQFVCIEEKNDE